MLPEDLRPMEFTQEAGEVVFVPGGRAMKEKGHSALNFITGI